MVRELEEEKGGLLVLAMGGRGDGTPASRRLLEIAISLTATILNQATKRGRDVLLLLPDSMEAVEIRSGDRAQLRQAESLLAMLSNDPGWPDFAMLPDRAAGSATILVHPGMDEPAAPSGVERISAEEVVARGWFRPKGGGRG